MASGKSTFGRALAENLGWNFLDLDSEIERREGCSPAEIISTEGEECFRRIESAALKSTAALKHTVIACGGGTPCFRDNMEFMTLHGLTLWLVVSPRRIVTRILEGGLDSRPLAKGKSEAELLEFVSRHLRVRQPYYCKAAWRFSGENLETAAEIEASVENFNKEFNLDPTK